jgi:sec-independent protein translocase protein TatA
MTNMFLILGVVGPTEIILILAIVLLLFGGKKLPELMRGIGQGAREFKKGLSGNEEEKKKEEEAKKE